MRMRLDLRKRPDIAQPGRGWLERTILAPRPYGCGDCGQWFAYPRELVQHLIDCGRAEDRG